MTSATTVSVRPWFTPAIVNSYVPAATDDGAVTLSRADLAVQPNALVRSRCAVHPAGIPETDSFTRSKNVELRLIVIATDAGPPVSGTTPTVGASSENVPSGPSFDTSSSFSWYESGSVYVFHLRLPRY